MGNSDKLKKETIKLVVVFLLAIAIGYFLSLIFGIIFFLLTEGYWLYDGAKNNKNTKL